jgi:hypothetical protein
MKRLKVRGEHYENRRRERREQEIVKGGASCDLIGWEGCYREETEQ